MFHPLLAWAQDEIPCRNVVIHQIPEDWEYKEIPLLHQELRFVIGEKVSRAIPQPSGTVVEGYLRHVFKSDNRMIYELMVGGVVNDNVLNNSQLVTVFVINASSYDELSDLRSVTGSAVERIAGPRIRRTLD